MGQIARYVSFILPPCIEKDGPEEDHAWDLLFLITKLLLETFQVAKELLVGERKKSFCIRW